MTTKQSEINASAMEAQTNPCFTCPFAGERPIELSAQRQAEIFTTVTTFSGSHLCHTVDNQKLCRGARDLQIKIAWAAGWIDQPTDAEFQKHLSDAASTEPEALS